MAEHWFYHPDLGPWCAVTDDDTEVSSEILGGYREGTVAIPPMPNGGGAIIEHEGHFIWSNEPAPDDVEIPSTLPP